MKRVSVIIPTLNEATNLQTLVESVSANLLENTFDHEFVIVDDGSTDGTPNVARELAERFAVKLIQRSGERGLASAVVAGMKSASGETFVVMDADGSHPPQLVSDLVEHVSTAAHCKATVSHSGWERPNSMGSERPEMDVAIGSRYIVGGSTSSEWSIARRLTSRLSGLLARPITNVRDPMSGMFAISRQHFESVRNQLRPTGFKILLEILAADRRARTIERPIHFAERCSGQSKLTACVAIQYLRQLGRLYFSNVLRGQKTHESRAEDPDMDRGHVDIRSTNSRDANLRVGFTVVELLVVIAIVGMLVALLLPAVQSAREASRRVVCISNLKNLAVAVQNFHEAHNHYPRNRFRVPEDVGPEGKSWSWIVRVMPFIEEQALFDQLDIRNATLGEKADLISRPLTFLDCPSDGGSGVHTTAGNFEGIPIGTTHYKAVCGANWGADITQHQTDVRSRWRRRGFNGSYDGQAHGDGIMWRDDYDMRMNAAKITDGLSKTFLLGEDLPDKNSWNSWAYNTHTFGTCAIPQNTTGVDARWWPDSMGFRSGHPGGANFAFADGAVRFTVNGVAEFQSLATRQ